MLSATGRVPGHPPASTGFVDGHQHVWDLSHRDQPWLAEDGLEPLRRSFGTEDLRNAAAPGLCDRLLEATVLVQCLASTAETEELLALADEDPLVTGVVGWIDLTAADVGGELDRLQGLPGGERLVGVRHLVQGEADPRWLLRDDVGRGLAAVAVRGLRYDLLVRPPQLPAAVTLARRMPELSLVLDHAAKPPLRDGDLAAWSADLHALAEAGPVTCKLSGLVTEAVPGWTPTDLQPAVEEVLTAFSPQRTLFGSDWPVCEAAGGWSSWADAVELLLAGLSPSELDDVLRATAVRTYQLALPLPSDERDCADRPGRSAPA